MLVPFFTVSIVCDVIVPAPSYMEVDMFADLQPVKHTQNPRNPRKRRRSLDRKPAPQPGISTPSHWCMFANVWNCLTYLYLVASDYDSSVAAEEAPLEAPSKKRVRFDLSLNTLHQWQAEGTSSASPSKSQENVHNEAAPMRKPINTMSLDSYRSIKPPTPGQNMTEAADLEPVIDTDKGYARLPDLPLFRDKTKSVPKEPNLSTNSKPAQSVNLPKLTFNSISYSPMDMDVSPSPLPSETETQSSPAVTDVKLDVKLDESSSAKRKLTLSDAVRSVNQLSALLPSSLVSNSAVKRAALSDESDIERMVESFIEDGLAPSCSSATALSTDSVSVTPTRR